MHVSAWGSVPVSASTFMPEVLGPLALELQGLAAQYGCWELNLVPLEKQWILLASETGLSNF